MGLKTNHFLKFCVFDKISMGCFSTTKTWKSTYFSKKLMLLRASLNPFYGFLLKSNAYKIGKWLRKLGIIISVKKLHILDYYSMI